MKKTFICSLVLMFALSACTITSKNSSAEQTQQVLDLQSTVAARVAITQTAFASILPTVTTTSIPTETPTVVPSPTPVPVVTLTTIINANCRSGPSAVFNVLANVAQGTTATIVGQLENNGTWWKVELDNFKLCWISNDAVTVSGDTKLVEVLQSPPTPYPTMTPVPPSWNGKWYIRFSSGESNPEENAQVYNIVISQTGKSISSSFTASWGVVSLSGVISADGKTANGEMNVSGYPLPFNFYLVRAPENVNQFRGKFWVGNTGNDGVFCGGLVGSASYPSPCRP